MVVYSVDDLRIIVSDIAKQYGVKKVALFGSYSTGKQTSDSDIDLLIDKGEIMAPSRSLRIISNCSLVISLGYAFLILLTACSFLYFTPFFSFVKILNRLLERVNIKA